MNLSENFESVKNFAMGAAQTATQKAKVLAAVAKAHVSGKLYYRDYAVGEEMDTAEYLPWCQKIDESKKLIAELKDYIDDVKAADVAPAAPGTACEADFEDAEPKAEDAAVAEAPCCCEAPKEEEAAPAETPEIKIEVAADEPKAE